MGRIERVELWRAEFPLTVPYKVSSRTFHVFDPLLCRVTLDDGRCGWGEAIISPGYGHETPEGGWAFAREMAPRLLGRTPEEARALLAPHLARDAHAVTLLGVPLDWITRHPALAGPAARVPLLAPVNAMGGAAMEAEVEALLAAGYRTLKVKVGFEAAADAARVRALQRQVAGRATLRLDANQGFSPAEARSFAAGLDPAGIELLEQPCHLDDWAANAAVAAVAAVPVMLDESIFGLPDIHRAAAIPGVGLVKVKLKKLGGCDALLQAGRTARAVGLDLVLGDGVATELTTWVEAALAPAMIRNAGEMNGHLKLTRPLLRNPPGFTEGRMTLPAGERPEPDLGWIERCAVAREDVRQRLWAG
jgi:L-Ala-D/L-Glu epimerase